MKDTETAAVLSLLIKFGPSQRTVLKIVVKYVYVKDCCDVRASKPALPLTILLPNVEGSYWHSYFSVGVSPCLKRDFVFYSAHPGKFHLSIAYRHFLLYYFILFYSSIIPLEAVFLVSVMSLSVTQTVQHRMTGW